MDLSNFALVDVSEKPKPMTVCDPFTGAETDIVLHVMGFDAPAVVKATTASLRAEAERKNNDDLSGSLRRRRAAASAAAVVGWDNLELEGKAVKFSPEKALELFTDPNFAWIADQVTDFGGNRANFTPKPTGDASSGQDS